MHHHATCVKIQKDCRRFVLGDDESDAMGEENNGVGGRGTVGRKREDWGGWRPFERCDVNDDVIVEETWCVDVDDGCLTSASETLRDERRGT
jgi:hypothetical protein